MKGWLRRLFGGRPRPASHEHEQRLAGLERLLDHHFTMPGILTRATTHPSYLDPGDQRGDSYERLEFLGDSVLNLVVSDWLFHRQPDSQEGALSQQRAHIISRRFLSAASETIGLPDCILTGDDANLLAGGGRQKIAADSLEAIIGALYLDGGYEIARNFIEKHILSRDTEGDEGFHTAKNRLQELIHERGRGQITYRTTRANSAPAKATHVPADRGDINFRCQVWLEGEPLGSGWGRTKKEAEKEAALDALERLDTIKGAPHRR